MKKLLITAGVAGFLVLSFLAAPGESVKAATDADALSWCSQAGGTGVSVTGQTLDREGNYICRFPAPDGRESSCQIWDVYYGRCPGRPASLTLTDTSGRLLREGDLIRQAGGDPDIFIIKFGHWPGRNTVGFKRLFLNPAIFSFYGHLGGYANVHEVSTRVFDLFETSGLFQNCETRDPRVWATEVTGEDSGVLHHMDISGDRAIAEDHRFFERIFCINSREDTYYAKSIQPYYRISDIPSYRRRVCLPRPACLDSEPRCLLPEPIDGWCPRPTVTPSTCLPEGESYGSGSRLCCPGLATDTRGLGYAYCVRPGCYYQQVQCVTTPCNPILVCPTPTAGPGRNATVTSVTADWPAGANVAYITVRGTKPTPCDSVTLTATGNDERGRLEVSATVSPSLYMCAQVITEYSQQVSVTTNPTGTYDVYVNGTLWNTIRRY